MQPRLPVQVLPLEPQILLLDVIRLAHFLQRVTPHPIRGLPNVAPVDFGELFRQAVEVVVVVADLLQWAAAVARARVFIEVQAGLLVAVFLQQAQAVPGEAGFSQWITLAVVFGLGDAPTQRVVGHPDHTAVCVVHFNQSAFGVIGEALQPPFSAALFDHPAKRVIAVVLVLIGQQFVVHHQPGAGLRTVQQVGGGVVGEGLALAVQVVLAGDDAAGGVVVQQLAVLRGGLLVEFADEVVGGVVLEVLLHGRRHQRWLAAVAALA